MARFDRLGWHVTVEKAHYEKRLSNALSIHGETVRFKFRERLRQQARPLSAKEKKEKAERGSVWHEKINVPSGRLQLVIEGARPVGL